jgi:hypothetical protein
MTYFFELGSVLIRRKNQIGFEEGWVRAKFLDLTGFKSSALMDDIFLFYWKDHIENTNTCKEKKMLIFILGSRG